MGNPRYSRSGTRAVPEIILRGGHIFFQTPPPPGHTRSQSPPTPGHVSALINLPHYGSNMPWPPGQVTPPPPPPSDTLSTKHPPTPDKKVFAAHPPPEDNFWNSPYTVAVAVGIVVVTPEKAAWLFPYSSLVWYSITVYCTYCHYR